MTLSEIANRVTDIRTKFKYWNAYWHVSISNTYNENNITFFIDICEETREVRTEIKQIFGEPKETTFWEKEDNDYITYTYENRY